MDKAQLIFEALSSRARRRILNYLSATSLNAGEIADRFDISKPALSKHLKILEMAELIRKDKQGQFVYYSLNQDRLVNTLYDFAANFCPEGSVLKKESKKLAKRKQ